MTHEDMISCINTYEETKPQKKALVVYSLTLLYKIADKKLLPYLVDIRKDDKREGKRVWIFNYNKQIDDIIQDYITERNKDKVTV